MHWDEQAARRAQGDFQDRQSGEDAVSPPAVADNSLAPTVALERDQCLQWADDASACYGHFAGRPANARLDPPLPHALRADLFCGATRSSAGWSTRFVMAGRAFGAVEQAGCASPSPAALTTAKRKGNRHGSRLSTMAAPQGWRRPRERSAYQCEAPTRRGALCMGSAAGRMAPRRLARARSARGGAQSISGMAVHAHAADSGDKEAMQAPCHIPQTRRSPARLGVQACLLSATG